MTAPPLYFSILFSAASFVFFAGAALLVFTYLHLMRRLKKGVGELATVFFYPAGKLTGLEVVFWKVGIWMVAGGAAAILLALLLRRLMGA